MSALECSTIEELMEYWKEKKPEKVEYASQEFCINHKENRFIPDGIVDKEQWDKLPYEKRILFVLKEAYTDTSDHNPEALNERLKNWGPWGKGNWYRICEWTRGIQETEKERIAKFIPCTDRNMGNSLLKKIAVMNIKKSGGKSSSNSAEISAYANADAEEIKREIELINPGIVVCGATFGDLNRITGKSIASEFNHNRYYFSNVIGHNERLFIDFHHPAWHSVSSYLSYYAMVGIYQQALNEN